MSKRLGQILVTLSQELTAEGELAPSAVVKNFFTTAADGKNYSTNFYNLDAITSATHKELLSVRRDVNGDVVQA